MRKQRNSALIFFEGIDGSGKTTHALALHEELSKRGVKCVYVRPAEAILTFVPSVLREYINKHPRISPRNITLSRKRHRFNSRYVDILKIPVTIFFLAYAFIAYFLSIRSLRSNFIVICDRYFFDWFYNLWGNASITLIRLLPKPDIAFLLDIPVTIAFSRMHYAIDKEISPEYYESLRDWYLTLARQQSLFIIDSSREFEKTKGIILNYVINALRSDC